MNNRVEKHISDLSLNGFTSAAPFLQGAELDNMHSRQQLLGQTQRDTLSVSIQITEQMSIQQRVACWTATRVLFLRRSALVRPLWASVCRGAGADVLVCLGGLQEICADESVVAEQWCRRCSGVGGGVRKSERTEKSGRSIPS